MDYDLKSSLLTPNEWLQMEILILKREARNKASFILQLLKIILSRWKQHAFIINLWYQL